MQAETRSVYASSKRMNSNEVLKWLAETGTKRYKDGLARYGIVAPKAFGVPVGAMLKFAKQHGKDHALAAALWKSGWYEARLLAAMLDDPKQVTKKQMDAWAADFDNWGVCDTVCWHLFDYTPFAWEKIRRWSKSPKEYVKRAVVRDDGRPGRPQQDRHRRRVPGAAAAHREGRARRAQLREEGRQLGAAPHRRPQPELYAAALALGAAARGVDHAVSPLGRQGCAARSVAADREGKGREEGAMKDLAIRLDDRPGALAAMGEALGKAGVSVEGGGAFVVDGRGIAHFLVADAGAARLSALSR